MAFNIIDGEVRITDENGNIVTASAFIKDQLTPDVITYVLSVAVESILQSRSDGTETVLPTVDDKVYQMLNKIYIESKKTNMYLAELVDHEIKNGNIE